jgi:hypothetical protein
MGLGSFHPVEVDNNLSRIEAKQQLEDDKGVEDDQRNTSIRGRRSPAISCSAFSYIASFSN